MNIPQWHATVRGCWYYNESLISLTDLKVLIIYGEYQHTWPNVPILVPWTSQNDTLQSGDADIIISLSFLSQISSVLIRSWWGWNWIPTYLTKCSYSGPMNIPQWHATVRGCWYYNQSLISLTDLKVLIIYGQYQPTWPNVPILVPWTSHNDTLQSEDADVIISLSFLSQISRFL